MVSNLAVPNAPHEWVTPLYTVGGWVMLKCQNFNDNDRARLCVSSSTRSVGYGRWRNKNKNHTGPVCLQPLVVHHAVGFKD